jgi:hypoxanthine-DNA glycosylase
LGKTQRLGPGLAPIFGPDSRALLLGSFPSPKSREQGFYYGHPQNRFWPLMAALTGTEPPAPQDLEAKRRLILRHGLALWDSIRCCTITGASDASIRDVEPNDVAALIRLCGIRAVYCNGAASYRLYEKWNAPGTGLHAVQLPSTSPANAAWTPERLFTVWQAELGPWITAPRMEKTIAYDEKMLYTLI